MAIHGPSRTKHCLWSSSVVSSPHWHCVRGANKRQTPLWLPDISFYWSLQHRRQKIETAMLHSEVIYMSGFIAVSRYCYSGLMGNGCKAHIAPVFTNVRHIPHKKSMKRSAVKWGLWDQMTSLPEWRLFRCYESISMLHVLEDFQNNGSGRSRIWHYCAHWNM